MNGNLVEYHNADVGAARGQLGLKFPIFGRQKYGKNGRKVAEERP